MSVFPDRDETWIVSFICLGELEGPRFLDGRLNDGSVGLAPHTDWPFSGTYWAVTRERNVVKFRCMGIGDGPRFLDGRVADGKVFMMPMLASPLSGEFWEFEQGLHETVTLKCLGQPPNPNFSYLDGRILEGSVGLHRTPLRHSRARDGAS